MYEREYATNPLFINTFLCSWFAVTKLFIHNMRKDVSVSVFAPMVPVPAGKVSSSGPDLPDEILVRFGVCLSTCAFVYVESNLVWPGSHFNLTLLGFTRSLIFSCLLYFEYTLNFTSDSHIFHSLHALHCIPALCSSFLSARSYVFHFTPSCLLQLHSLLHSPTSLHSLLPSLTSLPPALTNFTLSCPHQLQSLLPSPTSIPPALTNFNPAHLHSFHFSPALTLILFG